MSQNFRAVKEIWNVHSSCFVEPEELIAQLRSSHVRLARDAGHRRCFCDGWIARVLRKKELARKLIEVTKAFSLWKAQISPQK